MSYNFAVWEGPSPLSNTHALSDYEGLISQRADGAPTAAIESFIEKLEAAQPDTDGTVWAAPLQAQTSGPLLYFGVETGHESRVATLIETLTVELELIAFDPQEGALLPSAIEVARRTRFQLPDPADLALHLAVIIWETLGAPTAMAGIVEHVQSTFYVQWMTRGGALVVEAQGAAVSEPEHRLDAAASAKMTRMGFSSGKPNWAKQWEDGYSAVDEGAELLAAVLADVRALPPGALMELQTLPI